MYQVRCVQQYSITEYRIIRTGDGLVAYTFNNPIKAYLKLSRLENPILNQEEELRSINWQNIRRQLRFHPHARFMSNLLPSI